MYKLTAIIISLVVSAGLIASSFVVRDGLLAISRELRDKPMPKWPEQIHLLAGGSPKLNLSIANLSLQPAKNDSELNMSIDNLSISSSGLGAPTTQPNTSMYKGTVEVTKTSTEPAK